MDLNQAKKILEHAIPFVERAGLKVLELRRGHVKCLMPLAGNVNHIGTMYAGALFTLAEIPGGGLCLSSFDTTRYFPVVKELDIKFLKPAKGDITIEITLAEEQIATLQEQAAVQGKVEFVLNGELKSADGTVVATSSGVYQIRALQMPPKA